MDYRTIYEYTFTETKLLHIIPLVLLSGLGFGVAFYLKRRLKSFSLYRQFILFFGYLLGAVPCLMLILTLYKAPNIIKQEKELKNVIKTKSYNVIEGKVEKYSLRESSGQFFESFSIQGVKFEYSDYVMVDGFHKTAKSGGPINKNGLQVKISYISKGFQNIILKLEMKQEEKLR